MDAPHLTYYCDGCGRVEESFFSTIRTCNECGVVMRQLSDRERRALDEKGNPDG